MIRPILVILFLVNVTTAPVMADANCAWAGGEYSFSDSGVYGELSVNEDCSHMTWKRRQTPETVPLERTRDGWKGRLERAHVELLENGRSLRISDGGVLRHSTAERKN